MAADDVQQLSFIELNRLTQKLQKKFKEDIARIYSDSIFCDLELVLGKFSVHVNSCVLEARANAFYTQLCSLLKFCSNGWEVNVSIAKQIQTFIRDIYELDDISAAESFITKYIKESVISPDFDQYVTPLTSPQEAFTEQKCVGLKLDSIYYSIVPLDWEKELAEQDFLIESFRSIFNKERCKTKEKHKKSAPLNFQSLRTEQYTRNLQELRKAVEEDCLLIQEDIDHYPHYIDPNSETELTTVKCCVTHIRKPESYNECGFFDAEDSLSPVHDSFNNMKRALSEKSKMSSNIDTGPDSGLATSAEDIPLDQESGLEVSKSISSSVSSDCCMWDSSTGPPQHNDLNSWVDSAPHQDNSGIQADFVDRVLEELVGKSQQTNQGNCGNVAECSGAVMPKQTFFIDASSLLDETEICSASLKTAQESDTKLDSPKCADASEQSLEIFQTLEEDCDKADEFQRSHVEKHPLIFLQGEDDRPASLTLGRVLSEDGEFTASENDKHPADEINAVTKRSFSTQVDYEKPPSLIRSNTFELGSEDDRLALLRQEYERRQGNLIFQKCPSQSSGPPSDIGSGLNQHCTSLILPDIDPSLIPTNPSLFPPHVVEDEIQTPDSLNSDLPDTGSQEKVNTSKVGDLEDSNLQGISDLVDKSNQEIVDSLPSNSTSFAINDVSSPLFSRRKTESAPILSGAAPPLSPENKPEKKNMRSPHVASAWVVDISDITNSPEMRRKKGDMSSPEIQSLEMQGTSGPESKSSTSSLGFFIDLKDPSPSLDDKCQSIPPTERSKLSRQSSDSEKMEKQNACEFFVDLNHPADSAGNSLISTQTASCPEKKLFSMFIDIGDKVRPKAKPELTSRSRAPLSPFSSKKKNALQGSIAPSDGIEKKPSGSDEGENRNNMGTIKDVTPPSRLSSAAPNPDPKKNNFFMFIESESNSSNQKAHSSPRSLIGNNSQNGKEKTKPKIQHVRAHSVSSVKRCISSTLPTSSRHLSSQSLQCSAIYSDSDESAVKPMFSSFHSSLPSEDSNELKMHQGQGEMFESSELSSQITAGSNESSACSLETYSVHTPEQSYATDDYPSEKKVSSQNNDSLKECEVYDSPIETEDKCLQSSSEVRKNGEREVVVIPDTNVKIENKSAKSFVRLSDLDKEPACVSEQSIFSVSQRMSRSIPETSWIERRSIMSHSTGGGSAEMTNSSRSLSRLFPHLSMHSGNVGRSKTASSCSHHTEDFDTMRSSQVSDISSMQSSAGLDYSTESTDISSDRGSPATQLGDDLLRMFLEEINTDVIVEVGGRRIKAHKCILSSRCQYFAAILSGGWVESAGNVISLQGFSYTVLHFALCHIYSGTSTIPDQISIVELASLADMLSLEGLKDVIMYTLKVKYCHFFHKPCAVCSVGVLECLPLAAAYGLDDIYRKSLRWITKYFVRIWPTKTFTSLPRELTEKCYQQHVIHMTAENVLETILCCDKLLSTMPTVRWAEPVFVLTSRLMEACIKFMSDNFCAVLASENFLSLGREVPWNVSRFQESLVSACEQMPADQSCRTYSQLCSVLSVVQGPNPPAEMTWHPNFIELLIQLRDLSERTLIRQAARASRTPGWGQMPTELRRKIQDAACLVLTPADHASSRYKRSVSDGLRQTSHRSSYSRNLDLHQVKMAMVQHARRTNNSDHHHSVSSVVVRKNIPPDRSSTVTRRSAPVANNKASDKSAALPAQGRPKTWPAQVKSRYLEKRPNHSKQTVEYEERKKQLDAPVLQRRVPAPVKGMFISSSDSSRNSSPAMKRSTNAASNITKPMESARTRAATVNVCNSSDINAPGSLKEDSVSKRTENITRRSLSGYVKNQSASESIKTPPLRRKIKDSVSAELSCHDHPVKEESVNSQSPSVLGTHSQSITMSNDSLATVSSSDDVQLSHSEIKTKTSAVLKTNSALIASGSHAINNKKTDVSTTRTPLSLANKRASPSNPQRKGPLLASKTLENNCAASSATLMSKRSTSHVVKSPNLSNTGSRLAIPLRTSRSVSSVPDKGHIKANSSSESFPTRKALGKEQSRSNNHPLQSSKRASTGSSAVTNSSLAGRAVSSKGNKLNNSESKNSHCRNTEKVNGDSNLDGPVHPTVGPRSGTFLKDEPTVLKTHVVENN